MLTYYVAHCDIVRQANFLSDADKFPTTANKHDSNFTKPHNNKYIQLKQEF